MRGFRGTSEAAHCQPLRHYRPYPPGRRFSKLISLFDCNAMHLRAVRAIGVKVQNSVPWTGGHVHAKVLQ